MDPDGLSAPGPRRGRSLRRSPARTAILHLLPPSLDELGRFPKPPRRLMETLLVGAYPSDPRPGASRGPLARRLRRDVRRAGRPLHRQRGGPHRVHDVRPPLRGPDRPGSSTSPRLGADAGVSHLTARSWLSVLEASFLVFRVPAWHRNERKRSREVAEAATGSTRGSSASSSASRRRGSSRLHPSRGAIFETWVASETYKAHTNLGVEPRLHHLRETRGVEVDLLVERGRSLRGIESKSGATVASDMLTGLETAARGDRIGGRAVGRGILAYGGDAAQRRGGVDVTPVGVVSGAIGWLRGAS